jgi:hypothetical protein
MANIVQLQAIRRGVTGGAASLINLISSKNGELFMRKSVPDYASLVMEGRIWRVQDTTTTVVATATPTTTSGLTVQNPTMDKWYVVYGVSLMVDVSPASIGSVSLVQCAHKLPAGAFTRDIPGSAAPFINGARAGQGNYGGLIILDRAASVVDDGWTPIGEMLSNVVNSQAWMTRQLVLTVPVIIPPLMHWSMAPVGNSATFEAGCGLTWAELTEDEIA